MSKPLVVGPYLLSLETMLCFVKCCFSEKQFLVSLFVQLDW